MSKKKPERIGEVTAILWLDVWLKNEEEVMEKKSNGPASFYTNSAYIRAFRNLRNRKALIRMLQDFSIR